MHPFHRQAGPRPPHAPAQIPVGDFRLRKVGIRRYDLRDPYYAAVTAPWLPFLLAVAAVILLVNLVFAALYLLEPGAVQNLAPGHFADACFFSMETLSTVGYGAMNPASFYGHCVATTEMLVGLGLLTTLTGILFVRLSRPRSRILFADWALVNGTGDDAVLAIRIANGRLVPLVNAGATLSAVFLTPEGAGPPVWETHQLALVEDRMSVFPVIWTLEHRLSGTSPLAGFDAERFRAARVRLYLMVGAHDPAINADVQVIREYDADAFTFDRRYAEAVSRDADGQVLADLGRLSDLA